jgi:hypothetical protein
MPIVGRLDQFGSIIVSSEFDETTANGPSITGFGTYYATEFNENVVDIVRNGLVLNLDAGNLASYPGSGTTWTDVSGNGKNGTLTLGPTYSSANSGSIVFDGVDDYVNCGAVNFTSGTSITVEVWVKPNSSQNTYADILDYDHAPSAGGFVIQENGASLNQYYFAYYNGSSYDITSTITLNSNSFNHLVFVKSGTSTIGYLNSVNTIQYTGSLIIKCTGLSFSLGRFIQGAGREFKGNISNTKIYNRALTATEVLQNYNALATRYGLATTNSTAPISANIFAPYDPVYDEFAGVLFGPGQGTFMRQNTDKSVIVYNEINEVGLSSSYSITPQSLSINEGDTVIFTINATNVPDGTEIFYEII